MKRRDEEGRPGDETGPKNDVLPTPQVAEERALRLELERLNGTWTDGPLSVIAVPRPGDGLWIYLSGQETLYSNFLERAYVLGEEDARRLIQRFPSVLGGTKVVVRDRRSSPSASLADHRGEGRSREVSGHPLRSFAGRDSWRGGGDFFEI